MSKQTSARSTIGLQLPAELLGRIDAFAEQLSRATALPVTRSAAVRKLLAAALEHVQAADQARTGGA